MQAPLVPVTLTFLTGILLACAWPAAWLPLAGLAAAAAAIAQHCGTRERRWAMAMAIWMLVGALRVVAWRAHPDHDLRLHAPEEPHQVTAHGVLEEDPLEVPRADHAVVRLHHLKDGTQWQPLGGRVQVLLLRPHPTLRYGDEVLLEGEWRRPSSAGNPGAYDPREALARQRVHGILTVKPSDGVVVLGTGGGWPGVRQMVALRRRCARRLVEWFDARRATFLRCLLLGERLSLDEELRESFVVTGTMHLLVISGSHVGLMALICELVLRLLGLSRRVRWGVIALVLSGYCVLAGMSAPVIRSTLMAWAVLGALALGRIVNGCNLLAAAALCMLLIDPMQLFEPGFQLSFGAVLSLLLLAGRCHAVVEFGLRWLRPEAVRRFLATAIGATLAVWIGLWPMLAWYFCLLSPVAILANVLLLPLITVMLAAGSGLLLAALLALPPPPGLVPVMHLLVSAAEGCVRWCQALPGGWWPIGQPPFWSIAGYYGLLPFSLGRRWTRAAMAPLVAAWLVGLNLWAWAGVIERSRVACHLTLDVIDVGHGDSLLARLPGGSVILIDAGSEEAGRTRVVPYLRRAGIRRLDAVIITHFDADHLGGAIPVMRYVQVSQLLTNGAEDDTMTFRRVQQLAAKQQVPIRHVWRGWKVAEDARVAIEVLHPPRNFVPGTQLGENDNSLVLKLSMGATSVLLTGDLEEQGMAELLASGQHVQADILKVPHHGSALGDIGERFFQAVHPAHAVISVGRQFRLPASTTLEALRRTGARTLTTHRHGAIRARTDGRRWRVTTVRGDEPA